MNNDNIFIKQILNMTDDDCDVTDFRVEGHTKYITVEKAFFQSILSCMRKQTLFKRQNYTPSKQSCSAGWIRT